MAIQTRRGNYGDFDPQKMLPGEWATTISGDPNAKDGRGVYMCFAAGDVKRMATYEDMKENILEASEDVIKEVAEGLSFELIEATNNANVATQSATQAAQEAEQAKSDAEAAAESANEAAELANEAAENVKRDYYGSYDSFPRPGNKNTLYVDTSVTDSLVLYRWNGSAYVEATGADTGIIADKYNPNKTYALGSYCIHDDVLYKSNTAITTPEAWTPGHWKSTTVGAELAAAKAEIDALNASRYWVVQISNKKFGETVDIGKVVTTRHVAFIFPIYNSGTTMDCSFPVAFINEGEREFVFSPYDITKGESSKSETLRCVALIMEYITSPLDLF